MFLLKFIFGLLVIGLLLILGIVLGIVFAINVLGDVLMGKTRSSQTRRKLW